jgi:hypothetical protein
MMREWSHRSEEEGSYPSMMPAIHDPRVRPHAHACMCLRRSGVAALVGKKIYRAEFYIIW